MSKTTKLNISAEKIQELLKTEDIFYMAVNYDLEKFNEICDEIIKGSILIYINKKNSSEFLQFTNLMSLFRFEDISKFKTIKYSIPPDQFESMKYNLSEYFKVMLVIKNNVNSKKLILVPIPKETYNFYE